MAVAEENSRRTDVTLAATGCLILVALGLLTFACTNFPPGEHAPYGFHPHAVSFFRLVWGYPSVELSVGVFQLLACVAFLLFWGAYLYGLWALSRLPEGRNANRLLSLILGFALVYNIALILYFPPILSGDVFDYALQGRLWSVHGENPYATDIADISEDPFWSLAPRPAQPALSGPLWIRIASLCTYFGGGSVLLTVFLFKLLSALSNILCALLVIVLTRRLIGGDGVVPAIFVAWNPLLLLESAGNGENAAVMMALALLGVFLVSQARFMLGVTALVSSVLVQYMTALLLGLLLIFVLARQSRLLRLGLALRIGLFIAFLLVLAYSPFLLGVPDPTQLVGGASPTQNGLGQVVRYLTGTLLHLVGVDAAYVDLFLNAAFAVFVLLLLPEMLAPEATLADVLGRFGAAALVYTLLVHGGGFPWYFVCPITALAAATPTRTTLYLGLLTIGIGFTMQMTTLMSQ